MKRAISLVLAICMTLALGVFGANADGKELYAQEGEELVLFDTGTYKLTLTGESEINVNSKGMERLDLLAVLENNSDDPMSMAFSGTMNGWNVTNQSLGSLPEDGVQPGAKIKTYIWFFTDDVEADSYADLEQMHLSFTVWNKTTNTIDPDPVAECTVNFNAEAPAGDEAAEEGDEAEAPAAESAGDAAEPYSREVTLPAREYATLAVGSSGDAAKTLQQALIDQGFLDGGADGIYGNGTAEGVKKFQESAGLEATGTADSATQQKLYGTEEGETVTVTLTGNWKTEHVQMEGLYVDQSAVNTSSDSLTSLVILYAVAAGEDNLQVDGRGTTVTINDGNSYTTEHRAGAGLYLPNYYNSDYLASLYVGDELKVMETVWVPKGELEPGRTITLSGIEKDTDITLMTDDIVFCSDMQMVAQIADQEGYEQALYDLETADTQTSDKVKSLINGYYWSFYVNNLAYRIEFSSGNNFSISVAGLSNKGTYTVRNGYIVLYYPSNNNEVMLPYEFKDGDIDLDLTTAFDVKEM